MATRPGSIGIAGVALAAMALAQGPVGEEFVVNTTTAGDQDGPKVAMAPDGRFVAVWQEPEIRARLFDAAGQPIGDDFQVNADATGEQRAPAVAMHDDGSFLVTWRDLGSGYEARLFDAAGTPMTGDLSLDSQGFSGSVDTRSDGGFVIAYTGTEDGLYDFVAHRRLDASGVPVGDRFFAPFTTFEYPWRTKVRANPSDEYVVLWDSSFASTYVNPHQADGSPNGPSLRLPYARNSDVSVADDGSFWLVWNEFKALESTLSRHHPDGSREGPDFVLGATRGYGLGIALARDPEGQALAAWTSTDDLRVRALHADATPIGSGVRLNADLGGDERGLVLAADASGRAVALWSTLGTLGDDTGDRSIHARFLRFPLFSDGFESGDLSRWTIVVARAPAGHRP